ncbi:DUF1127 domain-containing protein [Rhizobium sp. NTR19]|jgi:Uncharacterized conserved small protein|uniref:DUF1127 domain-containing protein n=1 Tax=Neorhizobium turbinariae TaxID=2937795 RepID=A0ABT0IPW5_9HYPH|nr:DUF1127 domain-containing protein [Neorhizobium turbinariae]MCK8779911.1 DUF1127 domain-containing protein [Neorhizobium turbinariae]
MSVERVDPIGRFYRDVVAVVSRWWRQATTEQELQWLSDRDLADIGVARSDITELARKHAGSATTIGLAKGAKITPADTGVPPPVHKTLGGPIFN